MQSFGAGAFRALDDLLRGRLTEPLHVREGAARSRVFLPWALVLGGVHGFFIAWYAIVGGAEGAWWHMFAVMVKLPALFLLTLFVTFPSLYVFNALIGYGLSFRATLRLLVATIVVNLALAASLGPILAFFTLSTSSYAFIVLLNVLVLGIAGIVSVGFLLKALLGLHVLERGAEKPFVADLETGGPGGETAVAAVPADRERSPMGIFWVWILTYAVVGSQMGWLLRPFIGEPGRELTLLRPRAGSFVESVWQTTRELARPGQK